MTLSFAVRRGAALSILLAAVLSAGAASAQKLSLTAAPLSFAAKEKPMPVSATASVNVTIRNEGSEPLANVAITAKFNGLELAADANWKADGENARFEIAAIGPNEEISRPLTMRVEMAPLPPGKQIEVLLEAKAGTATANASAKFMIADCAAAFQADLTRLRIEKISEIWPAADEMRKPDLSLPRARYFPIRMRRGDLANLDRLAAGYQGRLLSNYDFFTEGVRYTSRRWSDELKAFAGQEPNPGICAVNNEMYEGIRKTIQYVTFRLEPPMKAYARGMELLRKQFNAEQGDDLRKITLKVAEDAGAKFESAPATALQVVARAKELLKDVKLTEEQIDNFSLLESASWVEAQAMRSKKLYDLIEGTITGIADAQRKNCLCAF